MHCHTAQLIILQKYQLYHYNNNKENNHFLWTGKNVAFERRKKQSKTEKKKRENEPKEKIIQEWKSKWKKERTNRKVSNIIIKGLLPMICTLFYKLGLYMLLNGSLEQYNNI